MRRVQGAERRISALFVLLGLTGLLALSWKSPQAWGIPPCPFLFLTGFFCPGCGSLRAVHSLLHGNLLQAIGFNPLLILLLPYLGFVGANEALSLLAGRKWTVRTSPRWGPRWGWTIFTVILAFWLLRNLPGEAFDPLRPSPLRISEGTPQAARDARVGSLAWRCPCSGSRPSSRCWPSAFSLSSCIAIRARP